MPDVFDAIAPSPAPSARAPDVFDQVGTPQGALGTLPSAAPAAEATAPRQDVFDQIAPEPAPKSGPPDAIDQAAFRTALEDPGQPIEHAYAALQDAPTEENQRALAAELRRRLDVQVNRNNPNVADRYGHFVAPNTVDAHDFLMSNGGVYGDLSDAQRKHFNILMAAGTAGQQGAQEMQATLARPENQDTSTLATAANAFGQAGLYGTGLGSLTDPLQAQAQASQSQAQQQAHPAVAWTAGMAGSLVNPVFRAGSGVIARAAAPIIGETLSPIRALASGSARTIARTAAQSAAENAVFGGAVEAGEQVAQQRFEPARLAEETAKQGALGPLFHFTLGAAMEGGQRLLGPDQAQAMDQAAAASVQDHIQRATTAAIGRGASPDWDPNVTLESVRPQDVPAGRAGQALARAAGVTLHYFRPQGGGEEIPTGWPTAVSLGGGHIAIDARAAGGLDQIAHEYLHELYAGDAAGRQAYDRLLGLAKAAAPHQLAQDQAEYSRQYQETYGRQLAPEVAEQEGLARFLQRISSRPGGMDYLQGRDPTLVQRLGAFARDAFGIPEDPQAQAQQRLAAAGRVGQQISRFPSQGAAAAARQPAPAAPPSTVEERLTVPPARPTAPPGTPTADDMETAMGAAEAAHRRKYRPTAPPGVLPEESHALQEPGAETQVSGRPQAAEVRGRVRGGNAEEAPGAGGQAGGQAGQEAAGVGAGKPRRAVAPMAAEAIESAAARTPSGTIYTGKWHPAAYEAYMRAEGKTKDQVIAELDSGKLEDGFTTSTGRFVNRDEAAAVASKSRQFKEGKEGDTAYAGGLKGLTDGPGVVPSEAAPKAGVGPGQPVVKPAPAPLIPPAEPTPARAAELEARANRSLAAQKAQRAALTSEQKPASERSATDLLLEQGVSDGLFPNDYERMADARAAIHPGAAEGLTESQKAAMRGHVSEDLAGDAQAGMTAEQIARHERATIARFASTKDQRRQQAIDYYLHGPDIPPELRKLAVYAEQEGSGNKRVMDVDKFNDGDTFTTNGGRRNWVARVDEEGNTHFEDTDMAIPYAEGDMKFDSGSLKKAAEPGSKELMPVAPFNVQPGEPRSTVGQQGLFGERSAGSNIGSKTGSLLGDTSRGPASPLEEQVQRENEQQKKAGEHTGGLFNIKGKGRKGPVDSEGSELVSLDGKPVPTNADGTITVYHRTSAAAESRIRATGHFTSQEEDRLFASTARAGQAKGYGEKIVALRVAPAKVRLEDAFGGGEVHVSMKTADADKAFRPAEARFNIAGEAGAREGHPKDVEAARKAWEEKGTDSPWFKRWFGQSKAVDDAGKPLVVYHGTPRAGFTVFNEESHFGSPGQAEGVMGRHADLRENPWPVAGERYEPSSPKVHEAVYPAYLSIENPLRVEDGGDWREEIARARATGHDGIVYANGSKEEGRGDSWIAFDPSQVKSATGNRGTFDAGNPDVRFNIAGGGTPEEQNRRMARLAASEHPPRAEEEQAEMQKLRPDQKSLWQRMKASLPTIDPLPRMSRASDELGLAANAVASSNMAAPFIRRDLVAKIASPEQYKDPEFMGRLGKAIVEENLAGVWDQRMEEAKLLREEAQKLTDEQLVKNPGDPAIVKLLKKAERAESLARNVAEAQPIEELKAGVREAVKDPAIKAAMEAYASKINPYFDRQYNVLRGIDPATEVPHRGFLMGTYLPLISEKAETLFERPAPDAESPRGGKKPLAVGKDPYNRLALGTGKYRTGLEAIMDEAIGQRYPKVAMAKLIEELQNAKVGVLPGRGENAPREINGRVAYHQKVEVPVTEDNGGHHTEHRTMAIDPAIASELKRVLDSSQQAPSPIFHAINSLQLMSLNDATYHGKNLMLQMARMPGGRSLLEDLARKIPGIQQGAAAKEGWGIFQELRADTPAMRATLRSMAERGLLRGEYPASGIRAITRVGHMLHVADTVGRVMADRHYDNLVERGGITAPKGTEADRRNFVSAFGNYNRRTMNAVASSFRDLGVSPFVVAGQTMTRNAIRSITGHPGYEPAAGARGQLATRAVQLAGPLAAISMVALINSFTTGRPGGRPGVPLGAIDLGTDDEKGKHRIFDALGLTFARRGLSATGLNSLYQGLRAGHNLNQTSGDIATDMLQAQLHPWLGPGAGLTVAALTGKRLDLRGKMEAMQEPEGGSKQLLENIRAAAASQNPLLYSLTKLGLGAADRAIGSPGATAMRYQPGTLGGDLADVGKGAIAAPLQAGQYKSVYPARSAAEELAARLGAARFPDTGPDAAGAKRAAAMRQLAAGLRSGAPEAWDDVQKAIADGTIGQKDVAAIVKRSSQSELAYKIGHLSGSEAADVYKEGTPEEQASIKDLVAGKVAKDSNLLPTDRAEILKGMGADESQAAIEAELEDLQAQEKGQNAAKAQIKALSGRSDARALAQRQALARAVTGEGKVNPARLKLLRAVSTRVGKIQKMVASGQLEEGAGRARVRALVRMAG